MYVCVGVGVLLGGGGGNLSHASSRFAKQMHAIAGAYMGGGA